jgi:hypothetical protein
MKIVSLKGQNESSGNWRHDCQHSDIQTNDTHHNDTQHNSKKMALGVT